MRITSWAPARYPVHCCLFDRACWRDYREFYMPMRLYLHFLRGRHDQAVFINLWGTRRHRRWLRDFYEHAEIANLEPEDQADDFTR